MSKGSGVRLSELNAQVEMARTMGEVVDKLRSAMSALDEGYVRFRERTPQKTLLHVYWIASNRVAHDALATLASRGDLLEQVTSLDELDSLFRDTLAVVRDLGVRIALPRLPAVQGEWLLYWTAPGGDRFAPVTIPVRGDTLLIRHDLFPAHAGSTVEVVLRNTRQPGVKLGHALVHFLSAGERKELRAWMCAQESEQPHLTEIQRLNLAGAMLRQVHGHGYRPDLRHLPRLRAALLVLVALSIQLV